MPLASSILHLAHTFLSVSFFFLTTLVVVVFSILLLESGATNWFLDLRELYLLKSLVVCLDLLDFVG
jgi:hypothetical protein